MASDDVAMLEPAVDVGAALATDMEAEEVAALLPLVERPFDAATYRPRTHVPPPGGILRFKGFIPGADEETLLREPMEHISADASTIHNPFPIFTLHFTLYIDMLNSMNKAFILTAQVRTLVDAADFGPFCYGLIQMRAESVLHGALVERWWDTTDSFHFSSTGEMTLTPYDFSMLTGLRVGVGGLVPFDPDMTQWRDVQLQLLGEIPNTTSHGMVRYNWFSEHFLSMQPVTADEVAQYTHGFLIYQLSTTLFANRENTVGLYIQGALVDLSRVMDYD
ncbi:hypothetical protein ACSBR2_022681 [Camellia fascicularis]